jgi:hypothetical protein
MPTARAALSLIVAVLAAGCMPKAPETPAASQVPKIAWEQKLAWIVRLEDQRLLRDPNPTGPAIIRPATKTLPALGRPAAPTDLLVLLGDP